MRIRLVTGLSTFALCTIAACGGSADLGDDFPVLGDGGEFFGEGGSVTTDASFFDDGGEIGFADASVDDGGFGAFGGDGGRRHRDGGVGGFDGGFFFDGGVGGFDGGISVPDAGTPPPPDDGGPQGPRDAGTLSGPLLRDANGVVLGEIVSIQSEGAVFTIVTSTDYVLDINFDGTFPAQAFAYSAVNCGGTVWLSSGSESRELLGNTVVYSPSRSSFMIPAGPLTNGAEAAVPIDWNSVGDPCSNSAGTGFFGWPLVATTAASVGLPATIAAPLSYP